MSFETNLHKICRTCLTETNDLTSIFSAQEIIEQTIVLSDILMTCASIQVSKGDGLPENVCLNCVHQMNSAFLFRKLCEKSDTTLRECAKSWLPLPLEVEISKLKNQDSEVPKYNFQDAEDTDYLEDNCVKSDNSDSSDTYKTRIPQQCDSKRKSYPCKHCNETCSGLGAYRRHMANNHGKTNKCETCHKTFKTETFLNRHLATHSSTATALQADQPLETKLPKKKKRNLPRTCTVCNKTFRFHSNLERHKLIHTGEKPYLCNVCGKGFAQLSYLKIHSFIHTGEKPYRCQMCEKCFAAPGTLMTHVRTHTGERPHVCKICGKDFPQSGYLSAHIRTHTGEKPVECKVCQRRFNQSGRLIIHMRIHSGEKPYTCRDCGRSFAVKGTLKKHIRTHTGERPYVCSVCGQAFAQSGTLATHMKVHKHKDLPVAGKITGAVG